MHRLHRIIIVLIVVCSIPDYVLAQCAMCRASLENNVSNGNIGIAAGINFGIMYLFIMPYLAIIVLAYYWYRSSRSHAKAA